MTSPRSGWLVAGLELKQVLSRPIVHPRLFAKGQEFSFLSDSSATREDSQSSGGGVLGRCPPQHGRQLPSRHLAGHGQRALRALPCATRKADPEVTKCHHACAVWQFLRELLPPQPRAGVAAHWTPLLFSFLSWTEGWGREECYFPPRSLSQRCQDKNASGTRANP